MNGNSPAVGSDLLQALGLPTVETRVAGLREETDGAWLCAWCHNRVAYEQDRFPYEGQNEFTFSNPQQIRFHLLTFSQTCGCLKTGVPTLAYTWFPDHTWCYCLCAECGQHLGWHYSGQFVFAGLIKDRIIKAVLLRN